MNTKHPPIPGRRGFLKGTLATMGAGLGVVLLPETAHAAGLSCCRDTTCPECDGAPLRYRCTNGCTGKVTCQCWANKPVPCFQIPC